MNDNELRASQWRELVAEFFVPLLGGTHEAWKEAYHTFVERSIAQIHQNYTVPMYGFFSPHFQYAIF